MSKEETLTKKKMSTKKVLVIILSAALIISIITGIALYRREHQLCRAVVSVEGLTFDEMKFVRCSDYKLTDTFEKTKIICKTTNGDWIIWSVEGYEENLEYVFANCFMDGYYYERVK